VPRQQRLLSGSHRPFYHGLAGAGTRSPKRRTLRPSPLRGPTPVTLRSPGLPRGIRMSGAPSPARQVKPVPVFDEEVRLGPGLFRCYRREAQTRVEGGRIHRFVTVEERTFELVDLQLRVVLAYPASA